MKRFRSAIRALRFLAGAVLSSALLAAPVQAESMTFTMEHFPPFNADDNGMTIGPFPDIVRATCAALKIQCVIETYPWRRAYRLVEEGQADGIFVLLRTPASRRSEISSGSNTRSVCRVKKWMKNRRRNSTRPCAD